MIKHISTIGHIRKNVLGLSQLEMAKIVGTNQSTVSRWETGASSPTLEELVCIRAYAVDRGIVWCDSWVFETPDAAQGEDGILGDTEIVE